MTPPKWIQRDMHTPKQIEPLISCLESIRKTLDLPESCHLVQISGGVEKLTELKRTEAASEVVRFSSAERNCFWCNKTLDADGMCSLCEKEE